MNEVFSLFRLSFILAAAWAVCAGDARADIYGYIDARGALHLTNKSSQHPYELYVREAGTGSRQIENTQAPAVKTAPATDAQYRRYVEQAARDYQIDAALLHAIIEAESAYQPGAVSRKGAIGLMQVLPQTAARYGTVNLLDPEQNIRVGARYLRTLQQLFKRDLRLVLAAYNAGEQVVMRLGNRVPPYPETIAYVARVTELYRRYREQS